MNRNALNRIKRQYGNSVIQHKGAWYIKGKSPSPNQGKPDRLPDGTPIRYVTWVKSNDPESTVLRYNIPNDNERYPE
ncbi:MAG: hypothetical protein U9N61_10095 [Euryarchaeota archaeon]|nr:hypothetical protein [Euryarchaeota archaeon]